MLILPETKPLSLEALWQKLFVGCTFMHVLCWEWQQTYEDAELTLIVSPSVDILESVKTISVKMIVAMTDL